ncbi:hypothetical protein GHT06_018412 [Daphnia sinensis]|uniref:Vitellogenin domain-containing protein n=1 Tax=Daphnia sinensis TaxID=1820382 RepID=A0AAD5L544_9CRUS|nr:hypothetical protein GHT06_018412 [Daphnia sinensis]
MFSHLATFLLLLCRFGLRVQVFETTVYDYAKPLNMGKIRFPDCVSVRYAIYSDERAAVKFPVTMIYFGQLVIVPKKIPIGTTASQCYNMINN